MEKPVTKNRSDATICMWLAFCISAPILSLTAFSLTQGPYSSPEQELWYRYGSLGFLLCGAVLPAVALLLGARRSRAATISLTAWMAATMFVFFYYACHSYYR